MMIDATMSLELDSMLLHREREYLQALAEDDPQVECLQVVTGKRRDTLYIKFTPSCKDPHRVPQPIFDFLYGKNIGYQILHDRPLRNAA